MPVLVYIAFVDVVVPLDAVQKGSSADLHFLQQRSAPITYKKTNSSAPIMYRKTNSSE
jgi:hypothetical protein